MKHPQEYYIHQMERFSINHDTVSVEVKFKSWEHKKRRFRITDAQVRRKLFIEWGTPIPEELISL